MQEWEIRKVIHWTVADCGLHPLIHTLLEFTLAQDIVLSKIHRLFRERGCCEQCVTRWVSC